MNRPARARSARDPIEVFLGVMAIAAFIGFTLAARDVGGRLVTGVSPMQIAELEASPFN